MPDDWLASSAHLDLTGVILVEGTHALVHYCAKAWVTLRFWRCTTHARQFKAPRVSKSPSQPSPHRLPGNHLASVHLIEVDRPADDWRAPGLHALHLLVWVGEQPSRRSRRYLVHDRGQLSNSLLVQLDSEGLLLLGDDEAEGCEEVFVPLA